MTAIAARAGKCLPQYARCRNVNELITTISFSEGAYQAYPNGPRHFDTNGITAGTWEAGPSGWTLSFTGSSSSQGQRIKDPDGVLYPRSSDPYFAVALDFKADLSGNGILIDNSVTDTSGWHLGFTTNGNLWSRMNYSGGHTDVYGANDRLTDSKWTRLMFIMEDRGGGGPYCKYYIWNYEDNVKQPAWAYTHGTSYPDIGSADMCIGNQQAGSASLNGTVSFNEIRFYRGGKDYVEHFVHAFNMGHF